MKVKISVFMFMILLFAFAAQAEHGDNSIVKQTSQTKTPKKTILKKNGKKDSEPMDWGKKNFFAFEANICMNNFTRTQTMTIGGFTANFDTKIATTIYNLEMNYKRRWKHLYWGGGFAYFYGKDKYTLPAGYTTDTHIAGTNKKDNDNYNFGMLGLYADAKFDFLTSHFTPFVECKAGLLWKFYEENGLGRQDFNCLYLKPSFGLAYMFESGRVELKLEPMKFFKSGLEDDLYEMGITVGYSVRF